MLLIEGSHIKKYFGDRLLLYIEKIKIYSEDRVGIIGVNGVGKTTLMNILSRRLQPDEGWVKLYGKHSYMTQLEEPEKKAISKEMASKLGVSNIWDENMSGGEKTRFKLAESLNEEGVILFADEPTSNVDMEGIELVEQKLEEFKGGLVIISHDRILLDTLCNKIIEVDNAGIKTYNGNYSDYRIQKNREREREKFEYEQYVKEKKRLENVIENTKQKISSIKKAPKRMGNSEARLHKMGGQKAKANLDRAVKNIESRIEHLEVKDKPKNIEFIKLDILDSTKLHSKTIIEGRHLNKSFGEKIILNDADFNINNGWKVALIGPNGCGKSTLIKMIMDKDEGIRVAQRAKIGYFSQDLSTLKADLTILDNVMETSIYSEGFVRLLLARLLFKGESVYKKVNTLSGGERVKVSFVKILLQDINLLILDEPTNYMDINSLDVIEDALKNYDRTILIVSHDRKFVETVADHIMTIENNKIKMFGDFQDYLSRRNMSVDDKKLEIEKQILLLQNRLSEIIGRISLVSKQDDTTILDNEYNEILKKMKDLKRRLPDS